MKVYLGFAKRDLPPFKQDDLFHWQAHEPKGGDLLDFYWREAEVADAEEADALYSPVDSAAGMVARLRMQQDGTLLEIAENAPVLRAALARKKAEQAERAVVGLPADTRVQRLIAALEDETKEGLWTRVVNWLRGG